MSKPSRRRRNPVRHLHEGVEWEPVWQGNSEAEAEIVAGGLHADGFAARSMGSQSLPSALPHAFLADTWAVFVPSSHASQVRRVLRQRGSDADVVESPQNFSRDQAATLKFVVAGLIAVALFAIFQELMNSL